MILDPFEREDQTSNNTHSKSKAFSSTLLPITAKQLNSLIGRNTDFSALGRVVLLGRVSHLKEMVGRAQVTLTDETGTVTIIEG